MKGLLNDSLLTVRGCHWCPPLTPNSMSWVGVPFSESLIVTPALPRTLGFRPLKVLGGRTGVGSLMYYLVNLLEKEIVSFLFPIQAMPPSVHLILLLLWKVKPGAFFQAWPGLQRYTQPIAKALRSKGLVRQTGRTQLNQKVRYGNIILKISESIHCCLLTQGIPRCKIILFKPS